MQLRRAFVLCKIGSNGEQTGTRRSLTRRRGRSRFAWVRLYQHYGVAVETLYHFPTVAVIHGTEQRLPTGRVPGMRLEGIDGNSRHVCFRSRINDQRQFGNCAHTGFSTQRMSERPAIGIAITGQGTDGFIEASHQPCLNRLGILFAIDHQRCTNLHRLITGPAEQAQRSQGASQVQCTLDLPQ